MNPLNLIARVLAPKREPAGCQPANPAEAAVLPPGLPPFVIGSRYPEAERIAASLRDFPGDWGWRMKGYELEHSPTGFVMWVANEEYGLAEVSSGHKSKFKPDEQKIIWPAVQAWLAAHKVGFTGRLPKVKIWRYAGSWRCMSEQHPWAGAGETPEQAYRSWARAVSVEARTDQRPGEILHVWSAAR
jgi:hypothetical protein